MAQKETRIMKKPIIILVSALILAGGSMGAFLAVKNKQDNAASRAEMQKQDNVLFSFDPEKISKMEFDLKDGSYVAELNDDSKWEIAGDDKFSVDETYLQLVRTYLSTLTAETSYGKADKSKKEMYGLDSPVTIKLSGENKTYELMIGDKSPTGDYYYVMTGDKKNVYAISSYEGTSLLPDKMILKSKDLMPYSNDEIASITVKNKNCDEYVLSYDTSNQQWNIANEYSLLETDHTAISSMVANLIRLEAEELIDSDVNDTNKFGFDDPDSEITVKGLDGTQRSFKVKVNKDDKTYSYVQTDDGQISMYYSSYLAFADATVHDYTMKKITGADMFKISGFDVKFGKHSDKFTMNAADKTCTMNGRSIEISDSDGYVLLQNFYNSFSQLPTTGIDIKAKPELKDPVLSVKYHLTEGGDTSIDVTEGGDGKYYIFRDGKYTGAYTDETRFTGRTSIEEFYLKFIAFSIKK